MMCVIFDFFLVIINRMNIVDIHITSTEKYTKVKHQ